MRRENAIDRMTYEGHASLHWFYTAVVSRNHRLMRQTTLTWRRVFARLGKYLVVITNLRNVRNSVILSKETLSVV